MKQIQKGQHINKIQFKENNNHIKLNRSLYMTNISEKKLNVLLPTNKKMRLKKF